MNIIKFYCQIPRNRESADKITKILNDQGYIVFLEEMNDFYSVYVMTLKDWDNEDKRYK